MDCEICKLRQAPWWKERAAAWFHQKWGIPLSEYEGSMAQCLERAAPVRGDGDETDSRVYVHIQPPEKP